MQNKNLIHISFNNAIYEYEEILRRARTMETNLDVIRRSDRTPQARHIAHQITAQMDSIAIKFAKVRALLDDLNTIITAKEHHV